MQFNFGIGNIYGFPVGGGAPVVFGTINAASLDISGDIKMLHGQNQYPDDVAVGKRKITGKVTVGRVDVDLFSQINAGGAVTTGSLNNAVNEVHSVPGSSTYTITATNSATFYADCGLYYQSTGLPLVQVAAGSEATGKYSVNQTTGVYTFTVGDAGRAIYLNYAWTNATVGSTLSVNQTLMGTIQTFQLLLLNQYKGKTFGFLLYSCVSDKMGFPIKQDDYMLSEFDFSAYANTAQQVYQVYNG